MKRILLACSMLLFAGAAWAQGPHEVHLSFSGPAGGNTYDVYSTSYGWGADLYSLYEPGIRVSAGPVYSLGYTYSLRSWLRLGAEASLGVLWVDQRQARAWGNGEYDSTWERLYTVMPLVHLVALDRPHFKIYGKIAAGVRLSDGKYIGTKFFPALAVMPIGLQWGGERVFGLAELGFGNVYHARIGVGFRW